MSDRAELGQRPDNRSLQARETVSLGEVGDRLKAIAGALGQLPEVPRPCSEGSTSPLSTARSCSTSSRSTTTRWTLAWANWGASAVASTESARVG